MKILRVDSPEFIDKDMRSFVEGLLAKQIMNDDLFDKIMFPVMIANDDQDLLTGLLYRRMWETTYLKRLTYISYYDIDKERYNVNLSLSEAIGYIYAATPPIIRNKIPDSIKSIDAILQTLRYFLIEDESGYIDTYVSLFKHHIRMEMFDTTWNINTDAVDMLRNRQDGVKNKSLVCAILHASVSFRELLNGVNTDNSSSPIVQLMFHCDNNDHVKHLCYFLSNHPAVIITNIKIERGTIYVLAYYSNPSKNPVIPIQHTINTDHFRELIRSSYKGFY